MSGLREEAWWQTSTFWNKQTLLATSTVHIGNKYTTYIFMREVPIIQYRAIIKGVRSVSSTRPLGMERGQDNTWGGRSMCSSAKSGTTNEEEAKFSILDLLPTTYLPEAAQLMRGERDAKSVDVKVAQLFDAAAIRFHDGLQSSMCVRRDRHLQLFSQTLSARRLYKARRRCNNDARKTKMADQPLNYT